MRALIAVLAATLAFAQNAWAQQVPRAEYGVVRLVLDALEGLEAPTEVAPGDVAWRAIARPRHAVRIQADTPPRVRPSSAPSVAAGTLLFGYQLSTGTAYCPAFDLEEVNPRVQCYRDFNDDGVFDGGYVTHSRGPRMRLYFGQLHGLAPIPQTPFEEADARDGPAMPAEVRFVGWRGDQAEFRLWIEGEQVRDPARCTPERDGVCFVHGVAVRAERRGRNILLSRIVSQTTDA